MTGIVVGLLVWLALLVPGGPPLATTRAPGHAVPRPAARWRPSWRSARAGTDLASRVAELASLVRAGLSPVQAWRHVGHGLGDDVVSSRLRRAAEHVEWGLSPVPALRDLTPGPARAGRRLPWDLVAGRSRRRRSDEAGLAALAATWAVHERSGAPVADLLDTLVVSLDDERTATQARRAAMAAPVATARVLAGLPLLGLLLGQLVGARPLEVLVHTPAGRTSGAIGLVCAVSGLVWTRRLVRAAARGSRPT